MAGTIGFIGFGEVASTLARRLCENGAEVAACDPLLATAEGKKLLEQRRRDMPVRFEECKTVIEGSRYIISAVPTLLALSVAEDCARYLKEGDTYLDINSTSPWVKMAVGEAIDPSGACFVEGAVLGAIGATGADTKILLGGPHAQELLPVFTGLGLNMTVFSEEIGKASVFKMLRGIFSKGLEAILVEALLAGAKAGIANELWQDFVDTLETVPFSKTADNWVRTHGPACERRYHEMEQVLETMERYGVAPVVTAGTTALFRRSTELGLQKHFPRKPDSKEQLIDMLQTSLHEGAG